MGYRLVDLMPNLVFWIKEFFEFRVKNTWFTSFEVSYRSDLDTVSIQVAAAAHFKTKLMYSSFLTH